MMLSQIILNRAPPKQITSNAPQPGPRWVLASNLYALVDVHR